MSATKNKPKGRAKGSKNKFGATARENLIAVFNRLGGTAAMARWAEANPSDFYRIYAKLVPQQLAVDANLTGNVTFVIDDPTKRPAGYERKGRAST